MTRITLGFMNKKVEPKKILSLLLFKNIKFHTELDLKIFLQKDKKQQINKLWQRNLRTHHAFMLFKMQQPQHISCGKK